MPRWLRPRRHIHLHRPPEETDDLDTLVDRLLQKIHEEGDASLTDIERDVLKMASEKYSGRGRGSHTAE